MIIKDNNTQLNSDLTFKIQEYAAKIDSKISDIDSKMNDKLNKKEPVIDGTLHLGGTNFRILQNGSSLLIYNGQNSFEFTNNGHFYINGKYIA